MEEAVQLLITFGYPLASIAIIIVAATRKTLSGKPWLITYLVINLITLLIWRIPDLLLWFDFDIYNFYKYLSLPLRIIGLAGYCLLIPFVFAAAGSSNSRFNQAAGDVDSINQDGNSLTSDTANPL